MSVKRRHAKGYNPAAAKAARAKLLKTRHAVVAGPVQPLPPAKSLSRWRLREMEQGQAGTCWVHAPTALCEWTAQARGLKAFPVCRRLIGYLGKALEGGGNPSDGGSGVDALLTMTAEKGAGIAHESLLPYSDSPALLGATPPPAVIADAKACHLSLPVDVRTLDEARALIAADHPVSIGVWCPNAWQSPKAVYDLPLGPGEYAHEVLLCGYADAGCIHEQPCFEVENWWGAIYPALPDAARLVVPGYAPSRPGGKTTSFWVTRRYLEALFAKGDGEMAGATDLQGLDGGIVAIPSTGDFL